jgi:hypothetical protein
MTSSKTSFLNANVNAKKKCGPMTTPTTIHHPTVKIQSWLSKLLMVIWNQMTMHQLGPQPDMPRSNGLPSVMIDSKVTFIVDTFPDVQSIIKPPAFNNNWDDDHSSRGMMEAVLQVQDNQPYLSQGLQADHLD